MEWNRITMSRDRLSFLLTSYGTPWIHLRDGRRAILEAVEREDGSGRSFNLRVSVDGKRETLYLRIT